MPAVVGVFTNNFRDEANAAPNRRNSCLHTHKNFPQISLIFADGMFLVVGFGEVVLLNAMFHFYRRLFDFADGSRFALAAPLRRFHRSAVVGVITNKFRT